MVHSASPDGLCNVLIQQVNCVSKWPRKRMSVRVWSVSPCRTVDVSTTRQGTVSEMLYSCMLRKAHSCTSAIELDLRQPSMLHGKKGFERVVWAFKNVLNHSVTWLFHDFGKALEGWLIELTNIKMKITFCHRCIAAHCKASSL